MEKYRSSMLALVLVMAVFIPAMARSASGGNAPAPENPAATATNQRIYCMSGWERFLPGDYYACRARYHLQRQHPHQAIHMLKTAAYWANKDAQHALGLAYINGDIPGIAANRALGIAWLALAAERKNADYVRDYSTAVLRSSPGELSDASKLYVKLGKTYGDRVAGKRATDRFVREVKPLDDAAAMGGNTAYISGLTPFPQAAFSLSRKVHQHAEKTFEGLQGTVTVGVLERIHAPTPALRERYEAGSPSK